MQYLDWTYPDDAKAKLDLRSQAGWTVNGSTLAHPYVFILWERPLPKKSERA